MLMPRPRAYSTGLTWLGRPLSLMVTSPVIGSHRGFLCPRGRSPSLLVVRGGGGAREPSWDRTRDAAASASRCARRSRRIMGMLDRWPDCGELDASRSPSCSRSRCDGSVVVARMSGAGWRTRSGEVESYGVGSGRGTRGSAAGGSSSSSMGEISWAGLRKGELPSAVCLARQIE